jgi:predicted Zn-ribbon and HTH transcriptional regulator
MSATHIALFVLFPVVALGITTLQIGEKTMMIVMSAYMVAWFIFGVQMRFPACPRCKSLIRYPEGDTRLRPYLFYVPSRCPKCGLDL